nr:Uncharacterised protein [Raoultella sp. NCTC 9187]
MPYAVVSVPHVPAMRLEYWQQFMATVYAGLGLA